MSKKLRPEELTIITGSFVPRSTANIIKKRRSTTYVSVAENVDHPCFYFQNQQQRTIFLFSKLWTFKFDNFSETNNVDFTTKNLFRAVNSLLVSSLGSFIVVKRVAYVGFQLVLYSLFLRSVGI